jgi:hypothetical protein
MAKYWTEKRQQCGNRKKKGEEVFLWKRNVGKGAKDRQDPESKHKRKQISGKMKEEIVNPDVKRPNFRGKEKKGM